MGDKLIAAPIDASKADLRILDSATGIGEWLISASKEVSPSATLVGSDLAPQHFVRDVPKNISFTAHNIFEEWPLDYHESFDLVHQRFVLTTCTEAAAIDAINKLFKCAKPGGWIQLHEGDSQTIQEGPDRKAFMRFREFVSKAWGLLNYQMAPALKLKEWLTKAGAVDIVEQVQVLEAGAAAKDKAEGELAIDVLLGLLDSVHLHMGEKVGFFSSEEDFQSFRQELISELRTVGNTWHYHVAYGRKPHSQEGNST
jgi:SAM-dependent methyltransferase